MLKIKKNCLSIVRLTPRMAPYLMIGHSLLVNEFQILKYDVVFAY